MSFIKFENVGSFIRECNRTRLRYDQACLEIVTDKEITFWSQYDECEGCVLLNTTTLAKTGAVVLGTLSPLQYTINNANGQICNGSYQFGEFGQYTINMSEVTTDSCLPRMRAEPDAAPLPILTAVVILLSMATLWYVVKGVGKRLVAGRLYARYFAREDNELGSETRVLTAEASVPRSPTRSRLRSLDIFRGIAIALMIFVNAGGGGYGIFSHSVWNGLTVADVVFPWFAFAMGEALVLSLNARLRTSLPRTTAFYQVARRSLLLALIGIILGSVNASWETVRLPGVLQRLAAMYFIVGALECVFMRTSQSITPGRSLLRDISAGWQQWLATLLIVAVQVTISLTVAAPGCPRGYLGPGGLHMSAHNMTLKNCTGGIAGYIDRLVLGENHLYQRGSFRKMYRTTVPYDPEGLLGILSGVLVVQAGAHATRVMLAYNHARARIMRWVFWSVVFGLAGGGLCEFSRNGGPIPINKNLWSLSYCLVAAVARTGRDMSGDGLVARIMRWVFWSMVFGLAGGGLCEFSRNGGPIPINKNLWSLSYCLVTAAMGFFIQAVLYFVVDLKTKWGGRPLYYAGQNALVLYIGSELLKRHFPLYWFVPAPTHAQLLATHAAAMLMWLAVGVALHRKRIFITL